MLSEFFGASPLLQHPSFDEFSGAPILGSFQLWAVLPGSPLPSLWSQDIRRNEMTQPIFNLLLNFLYLNTEGLTT